MKKIVLLLFLTFGSLFAFEELTANNYEQKVNNKNVILDFYATWWSACKILGKNLTKYDTSYNDNVTIYKVDFDTQPELYKKYKVRTVPVVVYLKNNKEVYRKRGISTVDEIKENVDKYFK